MAVRNVYPPRALPAELAIVAWPDPVIEAFGHGPDAPYIEECWLAVTGPTSTLLWRRAARVAQAAGPTPLIIETTDLLGSVGLGDNLARNGLGARAMARMVQFDLARQAGRDGAIVAVRTALPTLCERQVLRLPPSARRYHEAVVAAKVARSSPMSGPSMREGPDLRPGVVQVAARRPLRAPVPPASAPAVVDGPSVPVGIDL